MRTALKVLAVALPCIAVLLLGSAPTLQADGHSFLGPDGKVDKNQNCIDCHTYEYKAWQRTHHHDSKEAGESDLAFELTIELDLDEMRETPMCAQCHFTAVETSSRTMHYGVTCESCHGPASGWASKHNVPWEELEGIGSREEKLLALEEAGMIRPGKLYDLAENCFQCHIMAKPAAGELTVEDVVNIETAEGSHPASTPGFELLSWSHGEVRHNFRTPENTEDPTNPAGDHPRAMYAIGKLLDVEYSQRALALATDPDGRFFTSLAERLAGAIDALDAIAAALPDDHPLIGIIPAVVSAVPEDLSDSEAVLAGAEAVRAGVEPLFNGRVEGWPVERLEESLAPLADLLPTDTRGEAWRPE